MDIPELAGPFKLTDSNLSIQVRRGTLGAYVLGPLRADGHLTVRLTGRADGDLAAALRGHIDRYEAFGFARAASSREALDIECRLFHHFEPADNAIHPQPPPDSDWTYPLCQALG
ncbi:MAG TPA: hypothetical protein VHQ39_15620 [Dongiaceae bacterium]|jgi:hypothetical protein|nr:hypothetical protein [Dongiaceae bacterium]